MINTLPDYTSAWILGDLMQRRGRDFEEEARTANPDNREDVSEISLTDRQTLLVQATYSSSATAQAETDAAFAEYLSGQDVADTAPALLRALSVDSPPGSAFARLLAAGIGSDADDIRRTLGNGTLQSDYADWLTSIGYSAHNLFDVHTAFLMHSWSIANGGVTGAASDAIFAAVRDQLIDLQIDAQAPITNARNESLQQEGQSIALFTALLVQAWQNADIAERNVLRQGTAALGRRMNIDYSRVALTESGLEPR